MLKYLDNLSHLGEDVKVSNEELRAQWRAMAAGHPDAGDVTQLMETAEHWADAMEPSLDRGTPIVKIAPQAYADAVPQVTGMAIFENICDFMVRYLSDCWLYGETLVIWYTANRPRERQFE